jgi:hypothetical protein
MPNKEFTDYCEDLADLIISEKIHHAFRGLAISMFMHYVDIEEETPKMAIALVKKRLVKDVKA